MIPKPQNNDPPLNSDIELDASNKETLKQFEELVAKLARPTYLFRLYVAGNSTRSSAAIANIKRLCDEYLSGRYELEVVDVYQQPAATKEAKIIAVPTLVKEQPQPPQRIIGDMSNSERILVGLKLKH